MKHGAIFLECTTATKLNPTCGLWVARVLDAFVECRFGSLKQKQTQNQEWKLNRVLRTDAHAHTHTQAHTRTQHNGHKQTLVSPRQECTDRHRRVLQDPSPDRLSHPALQDWARRAECVIRTGLEGGAEASPSSLIKAARPKHPNLSIYLRRQVPPPDETEIKTVRRLSGVKRGVRIRCSPSLD